MHEDLLGYLLGALEPDEMKRVSEWLRDNPEGQAELERLERSLRPLEENFEAVEPPSEDLLERTLAGIPEGPPPQSAHEEAAAASAVPPPVVGLAGAEFTPDSGRAINRWRAMDSVGGLLAVAVLLALLLPSIAAGRSEARKVACADNLRVLHTHLMQYVNRDHQDRLPGVAASGPEAFAGIYAVRLSDTGLLDDLESLWCPSIGVDALEPQSSTVARRLIELGELPSVSELRDLPVNELRQVQQVSGGNYAYTLGVQTESGSVEPPRFESRMKFAVMSDAPMVDASGEIQFPHGNRGINVLYEDGGIHFVRASALGHWDSMRDHPLLNHEGVNEAGVHRDDASLAPSWRPPFAGAIQR